LWHRQPPYSKTPTVPPSPQSPQSGKNRRPLDVVVERRRDDAYHVAAFAQKARERIRLPGGGYRRDHLRALAQRVEVADREVRIMGSKGELLRALAASAGVKSAPAGVPSSVPMWRMGWDSNPRYACAHGGFQDRCLKPLGHPSETLKRPAPDILRTSLGFAVDHGVVVVAPSASLGFGPLSWPLAAGSRSTSSMTAMLAASP